ncbi:MAG: phage holin family protein [Gammaproteobacteria bacterium]|nr:phage holin family protein [Gammaproteobacteria bacterium]
MARGTNACHIRTASANFCMGSKMKQILHQLADILVSIVPAILGGVVDYINQIHNGTKSWSWIGFVIHLVSAMFFGWACGAIAAGAGEGVHIIAASGGLGGFLGVRVADLIVWRILGSDRRNR